MASIYTKKRKQTKMEARTKNFSLEEIELLLSAVESKTSIIENKKTDKVSTSHKDRAWNEVEVQFNSSTTGPSRSAKVLKTKYFNLKSELKKRTSAEKRTLLEAGGGQQIKQEGNPYDDLLKNITTPKQIDGTSSQCDSDSVAIEIDNEEDDPEEETECVLPEPYSWDNYTSDIPKSKISEKLIFPKSNDKKNCWTKLADVKTKWIEEKCKKQIEIMQIEHELRIAQMKELHELQMRLLIEKHEVELIKLRNCA